MINLLTDDLNWSVRRLPSALRKVMTEDEWIGRIVVAGGYLRAIVANEKINDVDVFCQSKKDAEHLALKLAKDKKDIYETVNAYTITRGHGVAIQFIHRWTYRNASEVISSFDFTICAAAIYTKKVPSRKEPLWEGMADVRFYQDLAAKRLVYNHPVREEEAGGSLLRVLKYYQRGYRIPLDSFGAIIARMMMKVDMKEVQRHSDIETESQMAKVITGLLREVDPNVDPNHQAHLPSSQETEQDDNE